MAAPRIFPCTWTLLPTMDAVEAAWFAAKEGFAGLEIQPNPLDFWPTTVSGKTLAELAIIADGEGIGYSLYTPETLNPASALPEDRSRDIDLIKRSVELARRLESPVLCVHPGVAEELFGLERRGVPFESPRFGRRRILEDARARAVETLADWADLAEQAGLVLVVENEVHVRHTVAPTAEILAAMIATTGRANVKVNFDTGHAFIGAGLAEEFAVLRDRIVHVHLNDGRTPGVSEHLPLGEGEADFTPLAPFMASFGGALVLEIYAPERAVAATLAGRDFLLRLIGAG